MWWHGSGPPQSENRYSPVRSRASGFAVQGPLHLRKRAGQIRRPGLRSASTPLTEPTRTNIGGSKEALRRAKIQVFHAGVVARDRSVCEAQRGCPVGCFDLACPSGPCSGLLLPALASTVLCMVNCPQFISGQLNFLATQLHNLGQPLKHYHTRPLGSPPLHPQTHKQADNFVGFLYSSFCNYVCTNLLSHFLCRSSSRRVTSLAHFIYLYKILPFFFSHLSFSRLDRFALPVNRGSVSLCLLFTLQC
mmetsp:Transcript_10304/g.18013  ORF Transcript_10304/g.18013 Transcript_10304/m.18013 type:complete len:248 (+) Transcript_10304:499-1242(+)